MTPEPGLLIDIAVCTYRRPALRKALLSIGAVVVPAGTRVRVIVADNDSLPSAKLLVDGLRSSMPFELVYVHCPASNISIARNACLEHACGDLLAFIDDDEYPAENWLVELVVTMERTQADVVLGPAIGIYSKHAPAWMRDGDFHSTLPVWVAGEIRTGHTCNSLLRLSSPHVKGRRFNLALGRTGGEDTEFFSDVYFGGGRIEFAPAATVFDPVPEDRACFKWLAKRKFRSGQTHGRLLRQRSRSRIPLREIAVASAKSGFCAVASVVSVWSPIPRYRYALRAVMHAGVVVALVGGKEIEMYGEAHSPGGKPHGA